VGDVLHVPLKFVVVEGGIPALLACQLSLFALLAQLLGKTLGVKTKSFDNVSHNFGLIVLLEMKLIRAQNGASQSSRTELWVQIYNKKMALSRVLG